jgi:phosphate transport system substrate-binding protein
MSQLPGEDDEDVYKSSERWWSSFPRCQCELAAAAELKISGAPAVAIPAIAPNKAAIEKETGLTLNMTPNNEVNGLNDLNAGKVDVAMLASPIKLTVANMNKANPGAISEGSFEVAPIGTLAIKFIVNPANPVKSLTDSQLKDIFTGKITSWKDVGGPDQPILLVAEVSGFPARADVEAFFLGTEVNSKARLVQSVVQVAQVVAQAPNAIGYGNAASITSAVAVIPGTAEIKMPLALATKGAPSAEVKKFIEVVAKFGAAVK